MLSGADETDYEVSWRLLLLRSIWVILLVTSTAAGALLIWTQKSNARIVKAKVPLSEQFGYVTVLRTLSSGRATASMEFSHYAEVPDNIAKDVVEKHGGRGIFEMMMKNN